MHDPSPILSHINEQTFFVREQVPFLLQKKMFNGRMYYPTRRLQAERALMVLGLLHGELVLHGITTNLWESLF
jgi:hypothetical protein